MGREGLADEILKGMVDTDATFDLVLDLGFDEVGVLKAGEKEEGESEDREEVLRVEGSDFCDFGCLLSLMDVMLKVNTSSGFGFRNCMKEWHAKERWCLLYRRLASGF